jgi:hypothetical protein
VGQLHAPVAARQHASHAAQLQHQLALRGGSSLGGGSSSHHGSSHATDASQPGSSPYSSFHQAAAAVAAAGGGVRGGQSQSTRGSSRVSQGSSQASVSMSDAVIYMWTQGAHEALPLDWRHVAAAGEGGCGGWGVQGWLGRSLAAGSGGGVLFFLGWVLPTPPPTHPIPPTHHPHLRPFLQA